MSSTEGYTGGPEDEAESSRAPHRVIGTPPPSEERTLLGTVQAEKDKSIHVAVNLSGHTIASPQSFGLVAGFLARHRALAPRILIEITETAEITDLEGANKAVAALREMGYRVGLDDFGAGAASLNYLHGLAVDFVKFDGSLVKKLGTSQRDDTLLRGMLKLCGELGMHTIAECIETQEQADMARAADWFDRHAGSGRSTPP